MYISNDKLISLSSGLTNWLSLEEAIVYQSNGLASWISLIMRTTGNKMELRSLNPGAATPMQAFVGVLKTLVQHNGVQPFPNDPSPTTAANQLEQAIKQHF